MKALVVGKGGREHALVCALRASPSRPRVYAYPGSDAILEAARPAEGVTDVASLVDFMERLKIYTLQSIMVTYNKNR